MSVRQRKRQQAARTPNASRRCLCLSGIGRQTNRGLPAIQDIRMPVRQRKRQQAACTPHASRRRLCLSGIGRQVHRGLPAIQILRELPEIQDMMWQVQMDWQGSEHQ
jgi:hypothetical protein